MSTTFQETLERLDRALERSRKQDAIDRQIASLSMRSLGDRLSGNVEGLKEIVADSEIIQSELNILR